MGRARTGRFVVLQPSRPRRGLGAGCLPHLQGGASPLPTALGRPSEASPCLRSPKAWSEPVPAPHPASVPVRADLIVLQDLVSPAPNLGLPAGHGEPGGPPERPGGHTGAVEAEVHPGGKKARVCSCVWALCPPPPLVRPRARPSPQASQNTGDDGALKLPGLRPGEGAGLR